MNPIISKIRSALYSFGRNDKGLAAIEGALILPLFLILLMGTFDVGQALVVNQKLSAAAHMTSDLITRQSFVSDELIDDAIEAARLVIDPYDREQFGLSAASIEFVGNGNNPQIIWRKTVNMQHDNTLPEGAKGLGYGGEGVLVVTAIYKYKPFFTGLFTGEFDMTERSFARGRRNAVIRMEE